MQLDDAVTMTAIQQGGGEANPTTLAWSMGVDELEVFGSLERLINSGQLKESPRCPGMVTI